MKIKHILGIQDNLELFPDYPDVEDIIFKLKNNMWQNKKIKYSDFQTIIGNGTKTDNIIEKLLELNIIIEKTVKDRKYYLFSDK